MGTGQRQHWNKSSANKDGGTTAATSATQQVLLEPFQGTLSWMDEIFFPAVEQTLLSATGHTAALCKDCGFDSLPCASERDSRCAIIWHGGIVEFDFLSNLFDQSCTHGISPCLNSRRIWSRARLSFCLGVYFWTYAHLNAWKCTLWSCSRAQYYISAVILCNYSSRNVGYK